MRAPPMLQYCFLTADIYIKLFNAFLLETDSVVLKFHAFLKVGTFCSAENTIATTFRSYYCRLHLCRVADSAAKVS